jgi:NACalpha-BTF3-like transcription factor
LAKDIIQQVLENDIKTVAERTHVTPEEIETMLKDAGTRIFKIETIRITKVRN